MLQAARQQLPEDCLHGMSDLCRSMTVTRCTKAPVLSLDMCCGEGFRLALFTYAIGN